MIVVADTSPFVVLTAIRELGILPAVFGQVTVPQQVIEELRRFSQPDVQALAAQPPSWLLAKVPTNLEAIPLLHDGEVAAISLARELNADLLVIDDSRGRRAAQDRKLAITGTIGVLELAAERNLLQLSVAFEAVKQTDFWVSHRLLDERLRLHLARQTHGS